MIAVSGSTRRPSCLTTSPLTAIRPWTIISSAARREATPACDSTFCSRTPSAGLDWDFSSDVINRIHFGQQWGERRQILQRRQSEPLQEQLGRAVQDAARLRISSSLFNQAAPYQGTDNAIHVDTPYRSHPGAGHRLAVGDHRQRL